MVIQRLAHLQQLLLRAPPRGQREQACAQMEELLKRQPAFRDARLALIQFYLDSGQEPKAQVVLQAWKQINPEDMALK